LRRGWKFAPVVVIGVLALAGVTHAVQGFRNPCERESNYFCIRVVDHSDIAPFGQARALVLDHLIHGINHDTTPELLLSPYVQLMAELTLRYLPRDRAARFFFAGGGAYTLPRGLNALVPHSEIVVAELDPLVTETAKKALFVDTAAMKIAHEDARVVLRRQAKGSFDVVFADAFHDISLPYHLATREYNELVKSRLRPNGLYVMNVLDVFPDPQLVKSMAKTLAEDFRFVSVWLDFLPEEPTRQTFVIAATDREPFPMDLEASHGMPHHWYRIDEPLRETGTAVASLPVLTDDYVPVEKLVSALLYGRQGR